MKSPQTVDDRIAMLTARLAKLNESVADRNCHGRELLNVQIATLNAELAKLKKHAGQVVQ